MSRPECKIEGCTRESAGRGMCKMHWRRWRKHGDPNIVLQALRPRKYPPVCSVDGCDGPHHSHGYCGRHAARFVTWGDPLAPPRKPTGRPAVAGIPGYDAAHKRVSRSLGRAKGFACIECGRQAQEWSYNGGDPDELVADSFIRSEYTGLVYSLDPSFYSPRCCSCHRKRDQSLVRSRDEAGRFTSIDVLTDRENHA